MLADLASKDEERRRHAARLVGEEYERKTHTLVSGSQWADYQRSLDRLYTVVCCTCVCGSLSLEKSVSQPNLARWRFARCDWHATWLRIAVPQARVVDRGDVLHLAADMGAARRSVGIAPGLPLAIPVPAAKRLVGGQPRGRVLAPPASPCLLSKRGEECLWRESTGRVPNGLEGRMQLARKDDEHRRLRRNGANPPRRCEEAVCAAAGAQVLMLAHLRYHLHRRHLRHRMRLQPFDLLFDVDHFGHVSGGGLLAHV